MRIIKIEIRLTQEEEKPTRFVKVKSHMRVHNGKPQKVRSHWRRILGESPRR